ncbi:MAG: DUF2917 domain-containing protein [Candidatus Accumulibacter sp.]|uniref:DUF2917 domain-containing protein n=1 Tax=Accumulibacter sp. TaxID=2053492 RepID=UPI001A51753A|nr:DUF2917 domain-containing protein [Accumulibacter sp.]MBL8394922.1 DUF2917 domain-containing protein [Accumulibacter sp.]
MAVPSAYIEFAVGRAEAVSLERLAGWSVIATDGRVWLTEEKEARDIWLLPGERHIITGAGRVVVESWSAGRIDADRPVMVRLAPPAGSCRKEWRLPGLRMSGVAAACA